MGLFITCDVCGRNEPVPRTHATTMALSMRDGSKIKIPNMDNAYVDLCSQCAPAYGLQMVNTVRRTLGVAPASVPTIEGPTDHGLLGRLLGRATPPVPRDALPAGEPQDE